MTQNRILLVDDDEKILKMLGYFFKRNFMEVYTAENAPEAVRLLKLIKPHLIITDLEMPGVDGFRFVEVLSSLLEKQGKKIPIIMLTSFASPENEQKCYDLGGDLFMAKPPQLSILLLRVQEFLKISNVR